MSFFTHYISSIFYSFPVQLTLLHFRKNISLLMFWGILWGAISGNLGRGLGIPYLFLDPEYLNQVSIISFFIVGLAFGSFTMVYHITCYILDSHKFHFIGTLRRPFIKFCLNNSLIPIFFTTYYIVSIILFQREYEQQNYLTISGYIAGFLAGQIATVGLATLYFSLTNRDYFRVLAKNLDKQLKKNTFQRVNVMNRIKESKEKNIVVKTYYEFPFGWKIVDDEGHFDRETITRIFDQNQLNALLLQCIFLGTFLFLGVFQEHEWAQIPAAASGFILCAILLMFVGAVSYWLREWSFAAVLVLLVILTVTFQKSHAPENKAQRLDYQTEKALYNPDQLRQQSSLTNYHNDYRQTIGILENWRAKFPENSKPKIVFLCVSGGGQRSAIWTLRTLQVVDSALSSELMKHTFLITGSSGGMIGAATYRELYLQQLAKGCINLADKAYADKMARDKLNPIIFNLVVNDVLFHWNTYQSNGETYSKDRGYALERKLLIDTDFILDKKVIDYALPEQQASIPILLLAPTIVNDGKKLYICAQNISYLNTDSVINHSNAVQQIKGVEFRRMFAKQKADSLSLITALRMSATFPYITPTIVLPSQPAMAIIDAGMSDNFGVSDAVRFLYVFRQWIAANTSGVILISIRDSQKERETRQLPPSSILGDLVSPLSNMLTNIANLQDIDNDNEVTYAREWFKGQVHTIDFQYFRDSERLGKRKKSASLSWRLTTKERDHILEQVYSEYNKTSLAKLDSLLKK